MKIYKYELEFAPVQTVLVPLHYKILSVQMQDHVICVWILIAENKTTPVRFEIFGTGQDIPDGHRSFVGTVQRSGYVWHIFELFTLKGE
jgi:hypothetical protein